MVFCVQKFNRALFKDSQQSKLKLFPCALANVCTQHNLFDPYIHKIIFINIPITFSEEYVTCHTCKSPDTMLQKEERLFFLQCETCGSRCSVQSIKSGFQAVTGRRAALRAQWREKTVYYRTITFSRIISLSCTFSVGSIIIYSSLKAVYVVQVLYGILLCEAYSIY